MAARVGTWVRTPQAYTCGAHCLTYSFQKYAHAKQAIAQQICGERKFSEVNGPLHVGVQMYHLLILENDTSEVGHGMALPGIKLTS